MNIQKRINKSARKYADKKVVVYGAGVYSQDLFENNDFSKLNIVAVADKKFENPKKREFFGYNCITPEDLKTFDCDVILIANLDVSLIQDFLEDELLCNTKNEDTEISSLAEEQTLRALQKEVNSLRASLLRTTPQASLKQIEIHLVEHCNLNCFGCNQYVPLAEKGFLDIEVFKKQIERLAELTQTRLERMLLLGGEPLLHPELLEFLSVSRELFPNTDITILTNGVLLNVQKESFWKQCAAKRITVSITKYPIKTNYAKIEEKAENYGVQMYYYGNTDKIKKTSYYWPLDLNRCQNARENFIKCPNANKCVTLKNGKLFTCSAPPHVHHFNKYFNQNVEVTEHDCIDIYEAQNINEILQFLAKPIPFCKYCDVKRRKEGLEWSTSKRVIEEWV